MRRKQGCPLCSDDLSPILGETGFWRLVLNRNQRMLGACFLVLNRHEEALPLLRLDEWTDLHQAIQRATNTLNSAFQPDHYNYCFLQNQDRHVHLHLFPRYARARRVAGVLFRDPDYPGHYQVPASPVFLAQDEMEMLSRLLTDKWYGISDLSTGEARHGRQPG